MVFTSQAAQESEKANGANRPRPVQCSKVRAKNWPRSALVDMSSCPRLNLPATLRLHGEHHAKTSLAAHHVIVRLNGAVEWIELVHRLDVSMTAEGERLLGID